MAENNYVEKVAGDLEFAVQAYSGLRRRPKAFKQLCAYPEIIRKLVQDPVFFASLMCGDGWLNKAPNHQNLLRDQSTRQVAVCGRGWGKSLVFSRKNLWLLFTKPNIESLIISSTQRQSMIMFDYCYSTIMANPLMHEMLQRPGTTRTVIKLKPPLNSKLVALPCSPDKLRGYHPDWIFLDEASIIPTEMITSEIMMMLTKPNSSLVMSGTPMTKNHVFHKAFEDAKRYSIHHYPSDSSPLVSQTQLAEWKDMMTIEEWQREVEAIWVEAAYSFFPMDLIIKCIDPELDNPSSPNQYQQDLEHIESRHLSGRYFGGLDLGKQIDFSVLSVVQLTDAGDVRLVHKRQFPLGTPYPEVIAYVTKASQVFGFDGVYVDKTGIGDAVVDELENIGISEVKGVFFTDIEKENMLNYLKLLMEKNLLRIQGEDKQLISQINEQQFEYMQPKTAQEHIHMKYRHPKGSHDDQLYSLALACYASKEVEPEPYFSVIPK